MKSFFLNLFILDGQGGITSEMSFEYKNTANQTNKTSCTLHHSRTSKNAEHLGASRTFSQG